MLLLLGMWVDIFFECLDDSLDEGYEFNMINYCVLSAFFKIFFLPAIYPIVEHGRPMPSGAQSSSESMKPSLYRMSTLDLCSALPTMSLAQTGQLSLHTPTMGPRAVLWLL